MDALPLTINRHQLELMHHELNQAIARLQDSNQSGEFTTSSERNLSTFGTKDYSEAHTLVKSIDDEIQAQLASWNDAPDDAKPVNIALNSYQIGILRHSLEQGIQHNNGNDVKPLAEDILSQLPENSPQENAD